MQASNLPVHIAIIMDGNRRWARQRNLDVKTGHKEGAKTLENIVRYAKKVGIKYITVYAFSTENWKRSEEEVGALMLLLQAYLDSYAKRADTEGIKVKVLGDISVLPKGMQNTIGKLEERTKDNTDINFNIALNYGGRDEIVKAVRKISEKVKNGELNVEDINEEIISDNLYTSGMPDPDVVVRTSGEMRTSNFFFFLIVYSEFIFVEKNWPEFSEEDLDKVIEIYQKRNRKFGGK